MQGVQKSVSMQWTGDGSKLYRPLPSVLTNFNHPLLLERYILSWLTGQVHGVIIYALAFPLAEGLYTCFSLAMLLERSET